MLKLSDKYFFLSALKQSLGASKTLMVLRVFTSTFPAAWLEHCRTAEDKISLSITLDFRLELPSLSMILSIHSCLSTSSRGVISPTKYLAASSLTVRPESLKLVVI